MKKLIRYPSQLEETHKERTSILAECSLLFGGLISLYYLLLLLEPYLF